MTTIHTRQLQQYTQDNSQQYTQDILKHNITKGKQQQKVNKLAAECVDIIFKQKYFGCEI